MKYILSLLFLLGIQSLWAQQPKPKYTMRDCINYALEHNINVQQAQNTVEANTVTVLQSSAERLPSLSGFLGGNGNTGRTVDPFSNGVVTQTIGTNNLGIGLNMSLYQGGRIKNTIERDRLNLLASQTDVEVQKNDIALQVAIAYLNLLSTEDLIEVANKQLEVTLLQLEKTEKMVKGGALPETNLYDLEAQKANDELSIINAENNHESAFLALKRTMNAPIDLVFDSDRTGMPEIVMTDDINSINTIYNTALSFLPQIKAADFRLSMMDKNIAIAKNLGLPTLSLSTNWGTAYSSVAQRAGKIVTTSQPMNVSVEFDGQIIPLVLNFPSNEVTMEKIPYFNQLGNNQNVSLGLTLNIPIFNRNTVKYQTQNAMVQKRQLNLQKQATELQIKQNIDQAYLDVLNARKKHSATLTQVDALEKSFVAAEKRYNAGAGTFVDYNLAKTNLERARINLILARYDYIFKVKILDFYQNKPLEF